MNKNYKGFWIRLVAFVIDLALLAIVRVFMQKMGVDFTSMMDSLGYVFTLIFVVLIVRFIITFFFWRMFSATPGKMIIGAKIADAETGGKPTALQFVKRYIGYFISLNPFLLGFLWSGWDKNKQAIHDKFAGTVVISRKAESTTTAPAPLGFMKYVFGIFFVLFVVGFFILVPTVTQDVPIAEYTEEWKTAELPEPIPQDNGYYYFVGLLVAEENDPYTVGYDYIQKSNELTKKQIDDPDFNPGRRALEENLGSSLFPHKFTKVLLSDSLEVLQDNEPEIKKLMKRYSYIEPRFEEMLSKPYFRNTMIPIPEVRIYLQFVNYFRIVSANAVLDYADGNKKEALQSLGNHLQFSRYLSENATLLIEKLVFVITSHITLNTYSRLLDIELSPELYKSIKDLAEFTAEENSMRNAYRGEAMLMHPEYGNSIARDMQRGLDSQPFLQTDIGKEILGFIYKPNSTFNINADAFEYLSDKADLMGQDFIMEYHNPVFLTTNLWDYVRNPIGTILFSDKFVSNIFLSYAIKNKIVGANIVLLKLKAEIIKQNVPADQVAEFLQKQPKELWNPVSGEPVVWDSETNELFLGLPIEIEDESGRRMKIEF